jgi:plastocyanin
MLVIVVVAAGLVSACGSAAPPAAAPPPAMPHTQQDSSADPGAPVATNTVAITNFAFSPAVATVRVGSTITWTNQDGEPHTVTSKDGSGLLRSPSLNTGESFTFTFTKPGRFEYLCTIHPFMTATVVVTA